MNQITIVIPDERPISWNTLYGGKHWSWRSKEKNRVRLLVRAYLDVDTSPYNVPVDIEVTAFFKNRPLDSDNICAKLYIDALKGFLLAEDDRRYVRRVTTLAAVDKDNPRVVIHIQPHKGV